MDIRIPEPQNLSNKMARGYVERLEEIINGYKKELKEDEALIATVILNDGNHLQVNYFGYYNPFIVRVSGVDNSGQIC
jgi:hypothetical protein